MGELVVVLTRQSEGQFAPQKNVWEEEYRRQDGRVVKGAGSWIQISPLLEKRKQHHGIVDARSRTI